MTYTLYHGDCLNILPTLEAGSVDAVITDPPYGTTACKWDSVIPFAPMWEQVNRVIKPNGAVCLFGSEPFSSALRMSNIKNYKYDWIWEKERATGFQTVKTQPMRKTENIMVFSLGTVASCSPRNMKYTPQGVIEVNTVKTVSKKPAYIGARPNQDGKQYIAQYKNYPNNILKYSRDKSKTHPTQKPVALLEYLIRTYTNEGDTVLDFTMGSGTTGVACMRTGRNFIGIELDADYFRIAEQRIANAAGDIMLTDKERESGARMLPLF